MVLGSATAIMAMGLARLGTPVAFVGRVGDDVWGRYCLDDMASRGIDLSRVIRGGGLKTGVTVSITHPLDRALVTYLGAISALTGADVKDAAMAGLDHLHASSFFFQEGPAPRFPGPVRPRAPRRAHHVARHRIRPERPVGRRAAGDAARDRSLLPERGGARGPDRHGGPRGGPAPARERAHARRGQAGGERGDDAGRRTGGPRAGLRGAADRHHRGRRFLQRRVPPPVAAGCADRRVPAAGCGLRRAQHARPGRDRGAADPADAEALVARGR